MSSEKRSNGKISAADAILPWSSCTRKMLKKVGDRTYSCLTVTVALNHFFVLPFMWTALVALQFSCSVVGN